MNQQTLHSPQRPESSLVTVPWHGVLDAIPAAAYTCDATGRITYFNRLAESIWGRTAKLRDSSERYCGSYRLYLADGTPMRHDECWVARALLEGTPYHGKELQIERPNGTRAGGVAYAHPLRNDQGDVIGALNIVAPRALTDESSSTLQSSVAMHPHDALLAMIEVALSLSAGMPWKTSTFD